MAINERWNDARTGEQRESVCFVEVEAWSRQAEVVGEYLKKGSPILVEGSLKFENWVAEDGTNRNRLKVRLQRFEFTGPPNGTPPADEVEPPDDAESAEQTATEPATEPEPENTEQTSAPQMNETPAAADDVPF